MSTSNLATMEQPISDSHWTEVIRPKANPFELKFKEVWRYRDLLFLFVKRDFIAKYKQTVLGPFWHLIQPALTTAMSVLLYNVVAGIQTSTNPVLFQMTGIIIWSYFSSCISSTSSTFISNAGIFGKVYFPRLVSPLSVIISNMVQFGIQFFLLMLTMGFFLLKGGQQHFGVSWLMVPVLVIMMGGLSLGLGVIISSLTTKYRDLSVLIGFGIQLLMFASAVNIPLTKYQEKLAGHPSILAFVKWNPLAIMVDCFRNALLGGSINWGGLLYCFVWMVAAIIGGTFIFNKVEKTFMDTV